MSQTIGSGEMEPPADLSKLRKAASGDEALILRLVETFVRDYPAKLASLRHAAREGNASALERAAHGLRGGLVLFGAGPAASTATELEQLGRASSTRGAEDLVARLEREIECLDGFLRREARLS